MKITKENLEEILEQVFDEKEEHTVDVDCIVDAGLNPRDVDIKYAEQIPLSVPPIILGIIENDNELSGKLIIIDGNHRMWSYLNVHCVKVIRAVIKNYNNRAEAIIDAYKYNINHGKRLSDKEISTGIKKITALLRDNEEDGKKTFTKLSEMLNVPLTSIYEYVSWDKVENILGERIERMKAVALYFFLKDKDNGVAKLKKFWELNKNLSYRKFREATRLYKQLGKIMDYEQYKIQEALLSDDDDDGIETEEIIKPATLNTVVKPVVEKIDLPLETEENLDKELDDFKDEETIEIQPEKELAVNEEIVGYKYNDDVDVQDNGNIEIIYNPKSETHEEDNLVQVKGLVRKFSFETVMENIFDSLQEDILSSNALLVETIERNLHKNRDTFEKHKEEYLAILNNCQLVIAKMEKILNRANKDYKEV